MLAGSFSFTLMAEFAHVLTRECDWQIVTAARAALVALCAGLIAYFAKAKLVFLRPWRLWVRSVAGSCSMICTFFAFATLPAADVLTLTNTFPIWVAVLSWPLYGKPPGWKMLAAMLIGIVGVGLVEQPHLQAGNVGVFSALAAAFFTSVAMLGLHSLGNIDPRAIVFHFSSVATIITLGAYFLIPRTHELIGGSGYVAAKMAGMALTATIGQIFLTIAFRSGAPAKVSVIGLTQIVMALGFDACLWDRQINGLAILGTLLVIAPTAWLMTRADSIDELEPVDIERANRPTPQLPETLRP
jgi:drug/metabolite transporter (DMT)-like permease